MKKFKIEELVRLSVSDLDKIQSHLLYEVMEDLESKDRKYSYEVYIAKERNINQATYDELVEKANEVFKEVAIVDYNYGLILEAITLKEYGEEEDDYDYYPNYYSSLELWKENKGKEMEERLQKELNTRLIK